MLIESVPPRSSLLRALDRPARSAVELSHRPFLSTVAFALAGLGLVALASAAAILLDLGRPSLGLPRFDALRAGLEALAIVSPALFIGAVYLGIRMAPRTLLALFSLGVLTGGIVAVSLVPLMAFLSLVERTRDGLQFALSPLVPLVMLLAVSVVVLRTMETLDTSKVSIWTARVFVALLFSVFLFRFLSHSTLLASL